jgi:hypothetical protein
MSTDTSVPNPELRVTSYDSVSSFLIAIVAVLGLSVFTLTAAWVSIKPVPVRTAVPIEIIENEGAGVEDGSLEETLKLDAPGPENELAVLNGEEGDIPQVEETLDNVMDVADQATDQAEMHFEFATKTVGQKGSGKGTGKRALGMGPGKAGTPREQRWFVSYNDRETLQEYGKQLEYFKIELGMLTRDGKLVYLSKLSTAKPVSRATSSGKGESRLYMTWQGGARRRADVQLFEKAGIDVGQNVLMQFYPPEVEQILAKLELDYKKRALKDIRRTSIGTRPKADGYEFYVTGQIYFQK